MTFLENLEILIRKRFSYDDIPIEEGLEDILNTFKYFGEYLNKITSDDIDSIYELSERIWEYHLIKRDYENFKDGDKSMVFPSKNDKNLPGKIRAKQDINILKKARALLQYINSKDYRIMQGPRGCRTPGDKEPLPYAPIRWQVIEGKNKYQELINENEKECFLGINYRNLGLKAFDETIQLYEDNEKFIFANEYKIQKDVFHSYWYLSSLIADLETQSFEFFEKTEYYPPEKPNKSSLKHYLAFLRNKYNLKGTLDEKQLVDNL